MVVPVHCVLVDGETRLHTLIAVDVDESHDECDRKTIGEIADAYIFVFDYAGGSFRWK